MKHLFVVRHGDYADRDLTPEGISCVNVLAEQMKAVVGEAKNGHYLVSSTAPRAEQTARIISRVFGLETFELNRFFFFDGDDDLLPDELEKTDRIIEPYFATCDIVTIVSHYSFVGSYPSYVHNRLFSREANIRRPSKGQAVHFDIVAGRYQILPLRQI